jgi:hypothetical protein
LIRFLCHNSNLELHSKIFASCATRPKNLVEFPKFEIRRVRNRSFYSWRGGARVTTPTPRRHPSPFGAPSLTIAPCPWMATDFGECSKHDACSKTADSFRHKKRALT